MNMILWHLMDSNAHAADRVVDPFTWVLLAEEALLDQRTEEAVALIEEAFMIYDERQADRSQERGLSSPLDEIARASG